MRRLMFALAALAVMAPTVAEAASLTVPIDQTARIQVAGQAGSVIVGNPRVADVTVVDDRTLFVAGRGYGVTEIVILDKTGRTLYQGEVVVTAPSAGQVSVYRGSAVTEMACSSTLCAPRAPAQ